MVVMKYTYDIENRYVDKSFSWRLVGLPASMAFAAVDATVLFATKLKQKKSVSTKASMVA